MPFRALLRLLRSEIVWLLLECVLALVLLAAAWALVWHGDAFSATTRGLLWAGWLAAWPGLYALGMFRLANSVLRWDLVRAARRRRHFSFRTSYVLALLLVLLWVLWANGEGLDVPASKMPQLGEVMFLGLLAVQFFALALLTPAYTAGAIAEEKERRTLDFLLTSSLADRDIVLGKLFARVAHLALILLAGMPILSLLQFVGGIDPHLLLAGIAAAAVTLLSLGTLSVFNSVIFSKPRAAVFMTYLAATAYLLLSGFFVSLAYDSDVQQLAQQLGFPLEAAVRVVGSGNGFLAIFAVEGDLHGGMPVEDAVALPLRDYALFHLLVAAVLLIWATARLRPLAERDATARVSGPTLASRIGAAVGFRWPWRRPSVGVRPMLWKEVIAEPGPKLHGLGKALLGLFVAGSFLPVLLILIQNRDWESMTWEMNTWVRSVGTSVMGLLLLRVAIHAAGSVNGEHHRDTMVSLLTSPLETREILFAKWLGATLGGRAGWVWLGAIWLVGVATGGLHPVGVPLTAAAFLAYAGFVAAVGLWFSTLCRSSLTASVWTVLTVLLLWTVHWLGFLVFVYFYPWQFFSNDPTVPLVACFHALALTPPGGLAFLPFGWWEVRGAFGESAEPWSSWVLLGFGLFGPVFWLLLGWGIFGLAHRRFRRVARGSPGVARGSPGVAPPGT